MGANWYKWEVGVYAPFTNGGQVVADAFMRIYGIDIRKAGALNMVYLDVQRIE